MAFGTSWLMFQTFQECSKHSIKCTKCTITFHTTFFFNQNYRLTIIHSQTLQLSCNLFKLSQESCYLYLSNLSISTVKTPQFSPYNSSLNPISFYKLSHTTPKTLHNCPISAHPVQNVSTYVFLHIFTTLNRNQSSNFSFPTINSIT